VRPLSSDSVNEAEAAEQERAMEAASDVESTEEAGSGELERETEDEPEEKESGRIRDRKEDKSGSSRRGRSRSRPNVKRNKPRDKNHYVRWRTQEWGGFVTRRICCNSPNVCRHKDCKHGMETVSCRCGDCRHNKRLWKKEA
jgi:hypothetical protein